MSLSDSFDFVKNYLQFKLLLRKTKRYFPLSFKDRYPCLIDRNESLLADWCYVYHTAWAARILAKINPKVHVDVSSLIYFASIISAFVPVKYLELKKINLHLKGLSVQQADLTNLSFPDNSVSSLSCLHVVEHIGLGRYGDTLDPDGDLKAINELIRVLAPKGDLLFVVPIGKPRIQFNAHRIYSHRQIVNYFKSLKLLEFSLLPDETANGMVYNANEKPANKQNYGCGCYWFKKL